MLASNDMVFIIVHKAYELWVKQLLWELGAIQRLFEVDNVQDADVSKAVRHLERIVEIQRVIIHNVRSVCANNATAGKIIKWIIRIVSHFLVEVRELELKGGVASNVHSRLESAGAVTGIIWYQK